MDQCTRFRLPGSLRASSHLDGELHSHALDTLEPVLEVPSIPCTTNSNRTRNLDTGGASRVATGASTTAVASASGQPGPGVRRSVSITEKWLSPSDRRKSGTSGEPLIYFYLSLQE